MQKVYGRLLAMGCAFVLLAGCGGGGGSGTDTNSPSDVPVIDLGTDEGATDTYTDHYSPPDVPLVDQSPEYGGSDTYLPSELPDTDQGEEDIGCTSDCTGKKCGDDGCGASCGECGGATPYCEEGVCVPECAAESPVVDGWVKNSVSDMDFTGELVDVQLFHKLDIDMVEDGCISTYIIAMSKLELGCKFSIQMETDGA